MIRKGSVLLLSALAAAGLVACGDKGASSPQETVVSSAGRRRYASTEQEAV